MPGDLSSTTEVDPREPDEVARTDAEPAAAQSSVHPPAPDVAREIPAIVWTILGALAGVGHRGCGSRATPGVRT